MLNLRDIFQLVVDRLDEGSFSQKDFVNIFQSDFFHVTAQFSDELDALFPQRFLKCFRNISLLAKQFSFDELCHFFQSFTVVNVAGRDEKCDQFTGIVDDQMQLETIKPINRSFAALYLQTFYGGEYADYDRPSAVSNQQTQCLWRLLCECANKRIIA